VAETSTLAEDDADAVPSSLVAELAASADAPAVIEPPPVVTASASASAADDEFAELTSEEASVVPDAKPWPNAEPSPVDVPLTSVCAVAPSSVATSALAEPDAEAPAPEVARSTVDSADPASLSKVALVLPSAAALSVVSSPVVASVPPVAVAPVEADESAELPSDPPLCAEALPPADADAPPPLAEASECDDELAEPPPDDA